MEVFLSFMLGSSENLEQFLVDVPCLWYECDASLKVTRISLNAVGIVGVVSEELIGCRTLWHDRVFIADRTHLHLLLGELKPGQGASLTHRFIDPNGLPLWVSHSFKKVASVEGEIVRGCLVPLPAERCALNIDAKIIPQFVHKIGNHFQLINLLIGNMQRSSGASSDIDKLQQALDEAVELTRNFLNYAQGPGCQSEVELGEVLDSVVQSMRPAFAEAHTALNILAIDLAGIVVRGDPALLEVAFKAIIQNAIDATKSTGEVRVSATWDQNGHNPSLTAKVLISDTGGGMDEDALSHARDPFYTSHRERGGLGLSMAVRIIEQHGGNVQLSSAVGRGTQVEIVLPANNLSQGPVRQ